MKPTTILIGVAGAIAIVVVYKKLLAPPPKKPAEQVVDGLGGAIKGIIDLFSGGKKAPADKTASKQVPPPGGALDLVHSAYNLRIPSTGFVATETDN